MDSTIKKITEFIKQNRLNIAQVLEGYFKNPFIDLGFAKVDIYREFTNGIPEVVYCQGKSNEDIVKITKELYQANKKVFLTKVSESVYKVIKKHYQHLVRYNKCAKTISIKKANQFGKRKEDNLQYVLIVTAGTSDMPVAEEAKETLEFLEVPCKTCYDIGIANIRRLLRELKLIKSASIIIAIAGMEGALPGVIASLTEKPVIAVPTSIGYGTSLNGLAPLLTMLNSCTPGMVVVNIDNGFAAACFAFRVFRYAFRNS